MKRICITTLVMCLLLSGCSKPVEVMEVPELLEPVSLNIGTAKVKVDELYNMTTYDGSVSPLTKELNFSLAGQIGEIKVSLGDKVTKGQILMTLDETALHNQVVSLKEKILDMKSTNQLNYTRSEYDIDIMELEIHKLQLQYKETKNKEEQNALLSQIKLKKTDLNTTKLKLSQLKELQTLEITKLENDLKKLTKNSGSRAIISPFDGEIVYLADVIPGNNVDTDTTMIAVADPKQIQIRTAYINNSTIKLSDQIFAKIGAKEYQITHIPTDEKEYYKTLKNNGVPSTIFQINNLDPEIKIGEYACIFIRSDYIEKAVIIPAEALYTEDKISYVYVIEGDKQIKKEVTVGLQTNAMIEIKDGLKEGDEVYVEN